MYPHRIRLRGPWECQPNGTMAARRVVMPCRFGDIGLDAGVVRFERRFGYPGRIDDYERVFLTCNGFDGVAELSLNGQTLGRVDAAFTFEVTNLLAERNRFEAIVTGSGPSAGLWGEVALEIRCRAWLEAMSLDRSASAVEGRVGGTCADSLELYVIVDGRHAGYQVVRAGEAFRVPIEGSGALVHVELVCVSKVWWAEDLV